MKDILGAIIGGIIIAILVGVFCPLVGIEIFSWQWLALIIFCNGIMTYIVAFIAIKD
jgi:hypothetical protein